MRSRIRFVRCIVIILLASGETALAGPLADLDLTGFALVDPDGRWMSSNPTTTSARLDENASSSVVSPGWIISDFELPAGPTSFDFVLTVEGSGDDDFVGFVFGYQDNDHFYQVDWKRGTQSFNWGDPVLVNDDRAERGIKLKKIEGGWTRDGIWGGSDGGGVSEVAGPVDVAWAFNVPYRFDVVWDPPSITIWLDDVEIINAVDGTYSGGRIGFFGFSQDDLVFEMVHASAVIAPCFGDANGDGVVNFADITSVLQHWTADYAPDPTGPGDANGDGVVNFSDITAILNVWTDVCAGEAPN